eukprot:m.357594 g.357594  ORF g.357594 m.357594 type:complete len:270 (+) comp17876_c0_seq1:97-906(+)
MGQTTTQPKRGDKPQTMTAASALSEESSQAVDVPRKRSSIYVAPQSSSLVDDSLGTIGTASLEEADFLTFPVTLIWHGAGEEGVVYSSFNTDGTKMERNADGFLEVTVHVPPGDHEYKYLIDGELKYSPSQPFFTTASGDTKNIMHVEENGTVSGFTNPGQLSHDSICELEQSTDGRTSPDGSYSQIVPSLQDAAPPVALPPHLLQVALNSDSPDNDPTRLPEPDHVVLNHLYALAVKDQVIVLGTSNRYKQKFVTTVMYKPLDDEEGS